MGKIDISKNKCLKLTNVISALVEAENLVEFNALVDKINNYILSKGALPIGPIIQKTEYVVNDEGQMDVRFYLMRQSNNFIHSVELPYKIDSVIRVPDCMYARYIGPEETLKFAYDKISIIAFEEDIDLSTENYTILVDQQDDDIVADVFIQKKENHE